MANELALVKKDVVDVRRKEGTGVCFPWGASPSPELQRRKCYEVSMAHTPEHI